MALFSMRTACQISNLQMVKEAVADGFHINGTDTDGRGPLHWLAESGSSTEQNNTEILQVLLDAGFDLTAKDRFGRTPLYSAALQGNHDLGRKMIVAIQERGLQASFNTLTALGSTVLHLCCDPDKGNSALAYELIVAGADPMPHKQPGARQQSPMQLAASRGAFALCKLLYAFGADRDDGPAELQFLSRLEASVCFPNAMLRLLEKQEGPLSPVLFERMCTEAAKQGDGTLAIVQAHQARRTIESISLRAPSP